MPALARHCASPRPSPGPPAPFYAGALLKTSDGHALGTVCVLDTATISAACLGHIFDASHADPTSEGLDLGLSIAKRTADVCGCELTVKSRLDIGFTFDRTVPLAKIEQPLPA